MKWYMIAYTNEYSLEREHTFTGNREVVQMVMDRYRIDLDSVSSFTINDEPVDIKHYLGSDGDV